MIKEETFKFTDILVLTIALVFLFLLFGCNNNNNSPIQTDARFSMPAQQHFLYD